MQRREFAKSTILGMAVAATILPSLTRAATADPEQNILFSEGDPGHWTNKAGTHVPETTVASGKLTIKTPHPQSEDHYIVSHSVVLADGSFLSRKTFSYKEEPLSEHLLPAGYSGKLTVISTCNQHDCWVKTVSV